MSTTPDTLTIIAAPPIHTLAELRRQNSALLQRNVAGDGTTKPSPGELLGFLEAASKLGRSLDDFDERDAAQGIMDVWIAALLNQMPNATESTRPFTLEEFDVHGAKLDANDARLLAAHADAAAQRVENSLSEFDPPKKSWCVRVAENLPEWAQRIAFMCLRHQPDSHVRQRLLLRFVRLKEKSMDPYSVPLSSTDSILDEPEAKVLLQQLIEAGVVKKQENGDLALAHESLLASWPLLEKLIKQRRAFRSLARGWKSGGSQKTALLTIGPQLKDAELYQDRDDPENDFLSKSKSAGDAERNLSFSLVATALVVVSGLALWLEISRDELAQSNARLNKSNADLNKSNGDLFYAMDGVQVANGELKEANGALQRQLALAKTGYSAIQSIEELISTKNPTAIEAARRVAQTAIGTNNKRRTLSAGQHDIEMYVGLGNDPEVVRPIIEALRAKGFDLLTGIALPRKAAATTKPTTIRYFYKEDEALAREIGELIAPHLVELMPIAKIESELGADPTRRTPEREQQFRESFRKRVRDDPRDKAGNIPSILFYNFSDDDEAPRGFMQIVIEAAALPVAPPTP